MAAMWASAAPVGRMAGDVLHNVTTDDLCGTCGACGSARRERGAKALEERLGLKAGGATTGSGAAGNGSSGDLEAGGTDPSKA